MKLFSKKVLVITCLFFALAITGCSNEEKKGKLRSLMNLKKESNIMR